MGKNSLFFGVCCCRWIASWSTAAWWPRQYERCGQSRRQAL